MLHTLQKTPGSTKSRKRVGRGNASTFGKTCGRGHKGQKARSGNGKRIGFEGGQMPLHRRLPKRGFTNIFKQKFSIINLIDIAKSESLTSIKDWITFDHFIEAGLVKSSKLPLKILGNGELKIPLKIEAHKFSTTATKKITSIGGKYKKLNQ